jgi:hypothetical protein
MSPLAIGDIDSSGIVVAVAGSAVLARAVPSSPPPQAEMAKMMTNETAAGVETRGRLGLGRVRDVTVAGGISRLPVIHGSEWWR